MLSEVLQDTDEKWARAQGLHMLVSEVFAGVRALLDTPEKWGQGTNALAEVEGGKWQKVPVESPQAQRFCLQGAIMRVCGVSEVGPRVWRAHSEAATAAMAVLHHLLIAEGYTHGPVQWNDASRRTYEDVVLLLKRAQCETELRRL